MHILLTGSTGAIGSAVLASLISAGHKVTCPVRSFSKVPDPSLNPNVNYLALNPDQDDYTRFNQVAQGFTCIIHTGFAMSGQDSELETNVIRGLLDAAKEQSRSSKVVFILTTGSLVVGNTDRFVPDDELTTENCVEFCKYRLVHEELVLSSASENLATSVIRPCGVYGGSFVDTWFSACKKTGKIVLPETNGRISFIHKEDLGNFYRLVAEREGRGTFTVSEGLAPTTDEIIELAKKVTGVEEVERVSDLTGYLPTYSFILFGFLFHQLIDSRRGRVELGFVPKFNILRDGERLLKLD